MNKFIIAAAQSGSEKGNISRNILTHQKYINVASEYGANVIIFPELSLTGYEPSIVNETALDGSESILIPLLESAKRKNITIIAGCPIRSEYSKPYIGAFIIQPSQQISIYRKRYLHKGEDLYFIPSRDNIIYQCKEERIGIAICADIDNPAHPADSKKTGATIYASGVLMTPNGISNAYDKLSSYAKKYQMLTVMANYATETGGYETAGKSAIWNENGNLITSLESVEEALVISTKEDNNWTGSAIKISSAT
jgi:predicted amidohydrolase